MAIPGGKYAFTKENIDRSPTSQGVYALYDGDNIIYIGKAEGENGIRELQQRHKQGDEGNCTQNASHYRRDPSTNTKKMERVYLQEYKRLNGILPRCNDVTP